MINISFNLVSIMGLGLLALSVMLPILALTKRPIESGRVIQNFALAPLYFLAGAILIFYGWRFDPIVQFSQVLLVGLNAYWIFRDSYR